MNRIRGVGAGVLGILLLQLGQASAQGTASVPGPGAAAPESTATEPAEPSEALAATTATPSRGAPETAEGDRRSPAYFHGRTRGVTADEVARWIPRILFFPLHIAVEAVRLPLLALLRWAEQNRILGILPLVFHPVDVLYWHPNLALEAGIFTLPGLTVRLEDLGVRGHQLRATGAFGGETFWSVSLSDRWQFDPVRFGVRGGYSTRPNGQFFGIGPASVHQFVYYRHTRGDASAFVVVRHRNHVEAELTAGYAHEEIGDGSAPSIARTPEAIVALGLATFDLALASFELRLDTRAEIEENGGFHMHASVMYGAAPNPPTTQFLRVDADVEVGGELGYPDRVLTARVHVSETASLDGGPVPFQHLPTLGWELHRGFVGGRFRGDAVAVGELRYRYPVHYFVDMEWTVSAGNAFARDFSDFSFSALTGSLSVGFRTRRTGLDPISFAVGFGTTRFDRTFDLEGIRFYVASSQGL